MGFVWVVWLWWVSLPRPTTLLGNETYLPINMHTGGDTDGYIYGSLMKKTRVLNLSGTLINKAYTLISPIKKACAFNFDGTFVEGVDTHRAGTINGNRYVTCCWCGNGLLLVCLVLSHGGGGILC